MRPLSTASSDQAASDSLQQAALATEEAVAVVADAAHLEAAVVEEPWALRADRRPSWFVQSTGSSHVFPILTSIIGAPQTRRCLYRSRQGGHVVHKEHGPWCRRLW